MKYFYEAEIKITVSKGTDFGSVPSPIPVSSFGLISLVMVDVRYGWHYALILWSASFIAFLTPQDSQIFLIARINYLELHVFNS